MNSNKVKVAMPHGDYQGVGYEQLLCMLDDAEALDLCTITLYGSPRMVRDNAQGRMDQHIKTNVVASIEAAADKQLNIVDCSPEGIDDEGVSCQLADLGHPDNQSRLSAIKTLARAIDDVYARKADVVVSLPAGSGDVTEGKPHFVAFAFDRLYKELSDSAFTIYIDGRKRLATLTLAPNAEEAAAQITAESITAVIERVYSSLRRDFMISKPRIALVWAEGQDAEPLKAAIATQAGLHRAVYGPYAEDIMADEASLSCFDAVVGMYPAQVLKPTFDHADSSDFGAVAFLAGTDVVCTAPAHNARYGKAGQGDISVMALRNALYAAIDIRRNRLCYDEAHKDPLPKLYHERREDGDRPRFAAKKAAEAAETSAEKAVEQKPAKAENEENK